MSRAAEVTNILDPSIGLEVAPPRVEPTVGRSEAPAAAEARAGGHRALSILVWLAAAADVVALLAAMALSGHAPERAATTLPLWLVVLACHGLYGRRHLSLGVETVRRLFHGLTVAVAGVALLGPTVGLDVSRAWIAEVWLWSVALVVIGRVTVAQTLRALRTLGRVETRTVIIGTNAEARHIASALARQPWLGYRPVAFIDVHGRAPDSLDGLPVHDARDDVAAAVRSTGGACVVAATTALAPGRLSSLCAELQPLDTELRFSAGLPDVAASRMRVEPLDGVATFAVRRNELAAHDAAVKRAVDIVGSVLSIVLAAPLMAAVALAILVTSGRPILFRQERVGKAGAPFVIWKFRTMVTEAADLIDVLDLRSHNEADGLLFKLREDPRVTTVGRVLRRYGIDELPQLYNVLRGDMSLVGPRPPLPGEAERYDEWVKGRLRVKPGITGLWQVNGRHDLSFADYVRYDLFYVQNWSLTLDLGVMARTLPALLARRGSF